MRTSTHYWRSPAPTLLDKQEIGIGLSAAVSEGAKLMRLAPPVPALSARPEELTTEETTSDQEPQGAPESAEAGAATEDLEE